MFLLVNGKSLIDHQPAKDSSMCREKQHMCVTHLVDLTPFVDDDHNDMKIAV